MSTFTPQLAAPDRARSDPTKHVNYTYGMVLGVKDFNQEFAYLSGRDRWALRDLIGYGTASGLVVTHEAAGTYPGEDRGPRISVSPGVAVGVSGQLICVSPDQCAYLDTWLSGQKEGVAWVLRGMPPEPAPDESPPGMESPPEPYPPNGTVEVYVVLRYADCLTDSVPIPGEPCRSEDDLMQPSRARDDFLLELSLDRPASSRRSGKPLGPLRPAPRPIHHRCR